MTETTAQPVKSARGTTPVVAGRLTHNPFASLELPVAPAIEEVKRPVIDKPVASAVQPETVTENSHTAVSERPTVSESSAGTGITEQVGAEVSSVSVESPTTTVTEPSTPSRQPLHVIVTIPPEVEVLMEAIGRKTKLIESVQDVAEKDRQFQQLHNGHIKAGRVYRVKDIASLLQFVMALKKIERPMSMHPVEAGQKLIVFRVPKEYIAVTPWVTLGYLGEQGLTNQVRFGYRKIAGHENAGDAFLHAPAVKPQPTHVVSFVVDAKTGALTRWMPGIDKRAVRGSGSLHQQWVHCGNHSDINRVVE